MTDIVMQSPRLVHASDVPLASIKDPKIHDGSVPLSHGRQFKSVFRIIVPAGTQSDLLLQPGLNTGMTYNRNGQDFDNMLALGTGVAGVVNHKSFSVLTLTTGGLNTPTNGVCSNTAKDVAQWRGVSSACRITSIDSDQNNSGYWESIACTPVQDDSQSFFYRPSTTTTNGTVGLAINSPYNMLAVGVQPGLLSTIDWANDAGYSVGSIKDIHKRTFQCGRVDNEANFVKLNNQAGVTTNFSTGDSLIYATNNSSTSPSNLYSTYQDLGMTYRGIRLTAVATDMTVLVEYTGNIECIYDDVSQFNAFMTLNTKVPGHATAMARHVRMDMGKLR